jgi:hypothetical protein
LLDDQTVTIPAFEWSFAAAKAMHGNVVRVPFYAVRSWLATNPSWLPDYLDDAVLGVVDGDRILPLSEEEMPYLLKWQVDEGVRLGKNQQPQCQKPTADEPEDGWW